MGVHDKHELWKIKSLLIHQGAPGSTGFPGQPGVPGEDGAAGRKVTMFFLSLLNHIDILGLGELKLNHSRQT